MRKRREKRKERREEKRRGGIRSEDKMITCDLVMVDLFVNSPFYHNE